MAINLGGTVRVGSVFVEVNPLDVVAESNCEPALRGHYAPTVNVGMVIPKTPVFFGAGRRFDDEFSTWYGTGGVMWDLEPSILVMRTNVGSNYFSMTVG